MPALAEIGAHLRADSSPGVAPWAYVVLWLGLLQLGYAVYLIQLPDWSSLWTAAQASLLVAAALCGRAGGRTGGQAGKHSHRGTGAGRPAPGGPPYPMVSDHGEPVTADRIPCRAIEPALASPVRVFTATRRAGQLGPGRQAPVK